MTAIAPPLFHLRPVHVLIFHGLLLRIFQLFPCFLYYDIPLSEPSTRYTRDSTPPLEDGVKQM